MMGSPNFARFVYDGDGTLDGEGGPPGSDVIEEVFTDYFDRHRLASEPTPFDGRSDYFAFINVGIPAGGLFSGAEGIKTPEQVTKYGGTAGVAFDPCYHQACDDIDNLSRRALSQLRQSGGAHGAALRHDAGERSSAACPGSACASRFGREQRWTIADRDLPADQSLNGKGSGGHRVRRFLLSPEAMRHERFSSERICVAPRATYAARSARSS